MLSSISAVSHVIFISIQGLQGKTDVAIADLLFDLSTHWNIVPHNFGYTAVYLFSFMFLLFSCYLLEGHA